MAYVDGYVAAVPEANKQAYITMAEEVAAVFRDHGAMKIVETWGQDVPDGKLTSFPMAVKLEPGEVVVFSWVWWPDKAVRDAGMAAAMADPRMKEPETPLLDGKRMIFGGFEVIVDA